MVQVANILSRSMMSLLVRGYPYPGLMLAEITFSRQTAGHSSRIIVDSVYQEKVTVGSIAGVFNHALRRITV